MDNLQNNNIVDEVSKSFVDYSVSVITARAIPDLRDGLKPVHRRILYGMWEEGHTSDKIHVKSARIVGDVMGKYHPHGDSSIYEAMVRMAQDFSYRCPLVDGHGNFGNMDGDGAAAMRYTESRLSKISNEMLRDINKDTVNMVPNFDETEKEPEVLPSRFPNVLVNGTTGIAVGMATNIPPHNLGEVIDGCVAYIDNPEIDTLGLMQYIKGPDFPTGGIILGNSGIKKAYETGRGIITVRARAEIQEHAGRYQIVVSEVPYGVNTLDLKNKVAELVHNKVLEGISDYHSDLKHGQITISLKKDANAQVVLNNLYKHTDFQTSYGIILLMIDNKVPKTLGLKDIIAKYIHFQREVIVRRTQYDLKRFEERAHILEGLKIAIDNIDEVVKIIRGSKTDEEAQKTLGERFGLDDVQTNAILEMKLRRLTHMSKDQIDDELKDLLAKIDECKSILASEEKIYGIIKQELLEIKEKYADERRTEIDMTAVDFIEDESLIPEENVMITLSNKGYIKRTTADTFRVQNRGGVGVKGMAINDEDFVQQIINMSTHDYLMIFTSHGKVYRLKGYEIPEFGRQSKGLPIINLIPIEKDEIVSSVISVGKDEKEKSLVFVTKNGIVKKTALSEYENIRRSGKIALSLKEDDELLTVRIANNDEFILLGTSEGRLVKFNENKLRNMGRTATGVKGVNLSSGGLCICADVAKDEDKILLITDKGFGKQTFVREYRETSRGSKGVKALNLTAKNGELCTFQIVGDKTDAVIITDSGTVMRMPISQISTLGRVTQGVRLINLKNDQKVSSMCLIVNDDETSEEENSTVDSNND
ncbi:MAG: DNA gyrase subunit A [Bacilli bacterium]|nr:DNA gyrase subunit A [Bacilli bacterium]